MKRERKLGNSRYSKRGQGAPRGVIAGLALIAALLLGGCAPSRTRDDAADGWRDARQLVLVTIADWNADHGELRRFERDGVDWRAVGTTAPVTIGRAGAAWGLGLHAPQAGVGKREGDGRSPAGVYRIGAAFGYAPNADTTLPYRALTADDWCIDVDGSPLYNRIVDAREVGAAAVAGSTEPMRRDLHADGDQRYRLGFVIEHNPSGQAGQGSCIFAHLWKSPQDATAGCTAMDASAMQALLAWLRPEREPVFVLLPQAEYARLRAAWQLPEVQP
jgi:L,D-peptidoglycan transpeptidase YkuD (ErfK/YbiS/YcfS/YnhG family)